MRKKEIMAECACLLLHLRTWTKMTSLHFFRKKHFKGFLRRSYEVQYNFLSSVSNLLCYNVKSIESFPSDNRKLEIEWSNTRIGFSLDHTEAKRQNCCKIMPPIKGLRPILIIGFPALKGTSVVFAPYVVTCCSIQEGWCCLRA